MCKKFGAEIGKFAKSGAKTCIKSGFFNEPKILSILPIVLELLNRIEARFEVNNSQY